MNIKKLSRIILFVVAFIMAGSPKGACEDTLSLSWEPFTGKLAHTFTIATYSRTTTPIVHTFISWKGYTGYGEAAMPQYLGETTESVCSFLELAKDRVLSKCTDPFQINEILAKVDSLSPRNTAAKASIDMALNDLVGKISGLPWWKMHDINPAKAPLTSFTIGYDADDEVVREKVREASWAKILKVKLGISPDEDRRMIRLIREESAVPIYVDANQGWKTPEAALEMCRWLATQGVVLVEQPMAKELLNEHAWLKERSPLPIIADEACQRLSDIPRVASSYDGINIKLMKCTGLTEALKMVRTARTLGLKVMVGCMTETSAGISAAAQISPLVDYADLDGNLLLQNDCYDGVKVIDGRLTLNDRPGIGAVKKEGGKGIHAAGSIWQGTAECWRAAEQGRKAVEGSWRGNLDLGAAKLPIVINFKSKDGVSECTMDSPNQNAYGLPAALEHVSADSIAVAMQSLGAQFTGRIKGNELCGEFTQRGHRFPLTLTREEPLSVRRPQTPRPPFPYQQIDTTFRSADGTLLHGTLTLPEGFNSHKTKICVMVTGSGPQNRDEEIFEHRPFAVIADFLARNGVATFRYDDRGTALSEGNYSAATIDTFLADAKAAILFARGITDGAAGIIGHSEGGTIALLLAVEHLPDFVVSLAGMAVSGKETILAQNKRAISQAGFDEKSVDESLTLLSAIFDVMIRERGEGDSSPIDVAALAIQLGVTPPPALMASIEKNLSGRSDYFASLLAVDPRKGMSAITAPVLALNGSLDTQVAPAENLGAIRNGVKSATTIELPGLNHLFQHATTGEVAEYAEIRETFAEDALTCILSFINSLR